MARYVGTIHSLGDYVTVTTELATEDAQGRRTVGFFDRQQERFIDGLQIGNRKFGRMSCPPDIYAELAQGKRAELTTWLHPFLGLKPIRTGIVGIAYPDEGRVHMLSFAQLAASLLLLALLPLLWLIPAFLVGGLLQWLFNLGQGLTATVIVLVALSTWIGGLNLLWNYLRLRSAR